MSGTRYTLQKIGYFVTRGSSYHWAWARWRTSRFLQRVLSQSYETEYLDGSPQGRFFFEPGQTATIVQAVDAVERQATIDAADAICRHEFAFRGREPVRFDGAIDWAFAPDGNKDWRWDLNRHGWFETLGRAWHYTGRPDYARVFESSVLDWLESNPPAVDSVNWSSAFEVGYRINSWSWAYHLFSDCSVLKPTTRAALLRGIGRHCSFLHRNLEVNARNNHLLLESKSLLTGAMLFPGFVNAGAWKDRAESHLFREIRRQVHGDGVHGEMSTHYHRIIAGELLELMLLYGLNGQQFPADIAATVEAMADFENCVTRPDGSLPLIGDSASDDSYARVSARLAGNFVFGLQNPAYAEPTADEGCHWRLASVPVRRPRQVATRSRAFPHGGYYVMRSGETSRDAMHAVINCGPFGLASDPHHGHADALSIELFAAGRPWIVDSGVYSTHAAWPWRHYFRGTSGHNTVVIDGHDQAVLIDSRRASHLPKSACTRWSAADDEDLFDGRHDGFRRLGDDIVHRRAVHFVRGQYWVIIDFLSGRGVHAVESLFHCPDDIRIELASENRATLHSDCGSRLQVGWAASTTIETRVACGDTDPVQGWYAEVSGLKRPAPALVLSCNQELPVIVACVFVPGAEATPVLSIDGDSLRLALGGVSRSFPLV